MRRNCAIAGFVLNFYEPLLKQGSLRFLISDNCAQGIESVQPYSYQRGHRAFPLSRNCCCGSQHARNSVAAMKRERLWKKRYFARDFCACMRLLYVPKEHLLHIKNKEKKTAKFIGTYTRTCKYYNSLFTRKKYHR